MLLPGPTGFSCRYQFVKMLLFEFGLSSPCTVPQCESAESFAGLYHLSESIYAHSSTLVPVPVDTCQ